MLLIGRNAVLEALKHESPIDKIYFKSGEIEGTLKVILAKAREAGVVVSEAGKSKLDELSGTGAHQGVVAVCPAHEYSSIDDMLEKARSRGEEPLLIILDGMTDPHNLGAIIRTADACGAHGVIIPKRRSVGLTAIVSKASAGAVQHVPIARVNNTVRAIEELKSKGLWVVCADLHGDDLYKTNLTGPLAVVIGGEGDGAGRLVMEKCDFRVHIPMYGAVSSLNASVAAGVTLYEIVRRRRYS